jgi:hypothetical protein
MEKCSHQSCSKEKQEWLPIFDCNDIARHPWCVHCGVVKNISGDRFYKLGYWMNVLSKIANRYSLKQVQKRNIAKELASHELFNDDYCIDCSAQKTIFINIVKRYCKLNTNCIESFIY